MCTDMHPSNARWRYKKAICILDHNSETLRARNHMVFSSPTKCIITHMIFCGCLQSWIKIAPIGALQLKFINNGVTKWSVKFEIGMNLLCWATYPLIRLNYKKINQSINQQTWPPAAASNSEWSTGPKLDIFVYHVKTSVYQILWKQAKGDAIISYLTFWLITANMY